MSVWIRVSDPADLPWPLINQWWRGLPPWGTDLMGRLWMDRADPAAAWRSAPAYNFRIEAAS